MWLISVKLFSRVSSLQSPSCSQWWRTSHRYVPLYTLVRRFGLLPYHSQQELAKIHYREDNATYTYLERTYVHVHVRKIGCGTACNSKMVVVWEFIIQQSCIYGASEKAELNDDECYSVSVQLSNRSSFLSFEHGFTSENSQGIIRLIHCINGSNSLRSIDCDTVVTMECVIFSCQSVGFAFLFRWYTHVNHRFQQLPEAGFELFLAYRCWNVSHRN